MLRSSVMGFPLGATLGFNLSNVADNIATEFCRISQVAPQNLAEFAVEKRGPAQELSFELSRFQSQLLMWMNGSADEAVVCSYCML